MADANPTGEPAVNPTGSNEPAGEPTNTDTNGSGEPKGPSEAERKLQSERDKLRAELEQVQQYQSQDMFEKAAKKFLKENAETFTDVEVEDLAFAQSEDDFEKLAKKAQDRLDRVRNKALQDVHQVPDDSLTDEEADKELEKLQGDNNKPRGSFNDFLNVQFRRKR